MKVKVIIFVLFLFGVIFSQSIYYWKEGEIYNEFDIVYFDGVRYVAVKDGINTIPTEEGDDNWYRVVPFRFPLKPKVQPLFGPIGHASIKSRLLDDDFVSKVLTLCNFDLDFVGRVGQFREKKVVGDYLHSAWGDFMVINADWGNTNGNHWKALKDPSDTYRYNVITREYNKYKNASTASDTKLFWDIVEWFVSEGRKGAYEQIIHNIGDAGVPFAHALDNYLIINEEDALIGTEEYYELVIGLITTIGGIETTHFTGSIYDAISEYGVRTLETLNRRKEKDISVYNMAYGDKREGDEVWGVLTSAFAVGRFILADAILADLSLIHEKIKGEPFVNPNTTHTLTAYAKDPDAVLFLHKDNKIGEKKLTDTSELLIDSISTNYRLWHEPAAHPMTYYWDIKNNGEYGTTSIENLSFTIDTKGINLDSLKLRDDKEREIMLKVSGGNDYPVKVKNTCFTVAVKIVDDEGSSIVVKKELTFNNSLPVDLAEIKKGNTNTKPYIVKVKRKNIYSDDYDSDKYFNKNGVSAGGGSIKVLAGFTNPESYAPVYIDFFKKSYDLDGNASDQIISTGFDIDNDNVFERDIEGINQYINTEYSFDEKVIPEQRIVINNKFWLEPCDDDTILSFLDQHFVSSIWENDSSPAQIDSFYTNIIPNENYKFRVRVQDNEKSYSDEKEERFVNLPILTPPEFKSVGLMTISSMSKDTIEIYKNKDNPITLYNANDTILTLFADAYDPDNGSNAEDSLKGIKSYRWSIRKKDAHSDEIDFPDTSDFSDNDFKERVHTFSHKEIREFLGSEMMQGETYEVFIRVEDDDGSPDKKIIENNGCGFAITKVGEFILD